MSESAEPARSSPDYAVHKASDGQGPPSLPPTVYGAWRVADAYTAAQTQKRRTTVVRAIYLFVILALPKEIQKAAKVLGVELKDIQAFPSLLTLALSVAIAHLCSTMARGARLARAFEDDLEVEFSATEKLQIEVVTTDEFEETALLAQPASWRSRCYFAARVTERFLTYLAFLVVLFWSFWVAISQIFGLYQVPAATPILAIGIGASSTLLVLAQLRLAQYWSLRAQTLFDSFSNPDASKLSFPRKYSLTSTVCIGIIFVIRLGLRG